MALLFLWTNRANDMKKITAILVLLFLVTVYTQCKKETEDWVYCNCTIGSWVGTFKGDGNYYKDEETDAKPVNVEVVIEQFATYNLNIRIVAPDDYSATFYATKKDSIYYINVNTSNKSLVLNLKKKDADYKLTGTAKNFHMQVEPDTSYLVTDKVVSFDVVKIQE